MTATADTPQRDTVRLAGRALRESRHVCAFFSSREERNKVLMPFFKEGFDRGEKLFHIVGAEEHDSHVCACRAAGIDVEQARRTGQLEIAHWSDAYLQGGRFDPDRMIESLTSILDASRDEYGLTRLMGTMEWSLCNAPGVQQIIEYECRINDVMPRYQDPLICVYDLNRHSGAAIMDILRAHPMVIVGGVLQQNPLYIPPAEFLAELEARRTQRASQPSEPS